MNSLDPQLRDFILFCIEQQGNDAWPALYDEMAIAAGQRSFRGLGYPELKRLGLSLALTDLGETIQIVRQAVIPEQQL